VEARGLIRIANAAGLGTTVAILLWRFHVTVPDMYFWKRPPIRPLRLIGVAMFVITAILAVVPEEPLPLPGAVSTRIVALGDVLGLGP